MYICIHGHFYQPPRENPWLGVIQKQPSAEPFHDWNERIDYECYAPNGAARVLNDEKMIETISNNYELMSFNFGPTLLSWMQDRQIETYQKILDADRLSCQRLDGHGNAIAQVYNHIIMPLANERDKKTQILWGIADFEQRFRRKPEGMWLAETAADTASLRALTDQGIKFTILAPRQISAIYDENAQQWIETNESNLDTTCPYLVEVGDNKYITVFFYNGEIAQEVAFNSLLNDGNLFANRLTTANSDSAQTGLIHIATDGETYGHHHRFGEMALAKCFDILQNEKESIEITNYSHYLSLYPAIKKARIKENSSWSCIHGVERWRSDCGCHSSNHTGWNQKYRAPLRTSLDWLRDELAELFTIVCDKYFSNPWVARDEYIHVILQRNEDLIKQFIKSQQKKELTDSEIDMALMMLEMQRHCLLMYTSCAWFFDEVSGIESVQILEYAGRAIHLATKAGWLGEAIFIEKLSQVPSNYPTIKNAANLYIGKVELEKTDLARAAKHISIFALFERTLDQTDFYNFQVQYSTFKRYSIGDRALIAGQATIHSLIAKEKLNFIFTVINSGNLNILGYYKEGNLNPNSFQEWYTGVKESFIENQLPELFQKMYSMFGDNQFKFESLFTNEKQRILEKLANDNLKEIIGLNSALYEKNYALIKLMNENQIPLPVPFTNLFDFVLNKELIELLLNQKNFSYSRLKDLDHEFDFLDLDIKIKNAASLGLAIEQMISFQISKLQFNKDNDAIITLVLHLLNWAKKRNIKLNLWDGQNKIYSMKDYFLSQNADSMPIKSLFTEMGIVF